MNIFYYDIYSITITFTQDSRTRTEVFLMTAVDELNQWLDRDECEFTKISVNMLILRHFNDEIFCLLSILKRNSPNGKNLPSNFNTHSCDVKVAGHRIKKILSLIMVVLVLGA